MNETPNIHQFKAEVKLHYQIEIYNATNTGNITKIVRKWNPVSNVITSD